MPSSPFPGFTSLSPTISLSTPTSTSPSPPTSTTSLIVLCTWMDAPSRPILKYTQSYQTLFPNTPILLIRTNIREAFFSDAANTRRLQPAVSAIHAAAPKAIHLHAFSNGGTGTAVHLARLMPTRVAGLILDCAPSRPAIKEAAHAIAVSLPGQKNPVIGMVTRVLVGLVLAVYLLVHMLLGRDVPLTITRRVLNDGELIPRSAPRMYLFSKADQMVPERDVTSHAEEARKAGYEVKTERFEDAPHCALARGSGEERYWGCVRGFVEKVL